MSLLTPQYWSVRGMRGALQEEWNIAITSCLSLLAFSFIGGLTCLRSCGHAFYGRRH